MLTLSFNKSISHKLPNTLNLAQNFNKFRDMGNSINILLPVKEVFEKWETFHNLFWTIVDSKKTAIYYDNMTYHSHIDKTRIFYALQNSYYKWMNYIEEKAS